jgi:amidase
LPIGFSDTGTPVGLQLIAGPRKDARLLQVARTLEDRLGLTLTPIDPVVRHDLGSGQQS